MRGRKVGLRDGSHLEVFCQVSGEQLLREQLRCEFGQRYGKDRPVFLIRCLRAHTCSIVTWNLSAPFIYPCLTLFSPLLFPLLPSPSSSLLSFLFSFYPAHPFPLILSGPLETHGITQLHAEDQRLHLDLQGGFPTTVPRSVPPPPRISVVAPSRQNHPAV